MFDIGFSEMVLLAAIALIAIGPKQLPEVARTVGRLLNDLKRATGDLTKTVVDARETTNRFMNDVTAPFEQTAEQIRANLIPPTPIQTGIHQEEPILEEPIAPHEPDTLEPKEEQLSLLDQPQTDEKKKDV